MSGAAARRQRVARALERALPAGWMGDLAKSPKDCCISARDPWGFIARRQRRYPSRARRRGLGGVRCSRASPRSPCVADEWAE